MADDRLRSRRAFLAGVGRTAALVASAGAFTRLAEAAPAGPPSPLAPDGPAAPETTAVHDDLPPAPDAAVHAFLGPVAVGATFAGWTVARIHGVFRGALPLVLAHADGRRAQVDLLARDAASPPGVATCTAGHLYLVNSGRGSRTTPADLEAAIRGLAAALDGRRADGLALVGQAERHRRFPGGVYVVPA